MGYCPLSSSAKFTHHKTPTILKAQFGATIQPSWTVLETFYLSILGTIFVPFRSFPNTIRTSLKLFFKTVIFLLYTFSNRATSNSSSSLVVRTTVTCVSDIQQFAVSAALLLLSQTRVLCILGNSVQLPYTPPNSVSPPAKRNAYSHRSLVAKYFEQNYRNFHNFEAANSHGKTTGPCGFSFSFEMEFSQCLSR